MPVVSVKIKSLERYVRPLRQMAKLMRVLVTFHHGIFWKTMVERAEPCNSIISLRRQLITCCSVCSGWEDSVSDLLVTTAGKLDLARRQHTCVSPFLHYYWLMRLVPLKLFHRSGVPNMPKRSWIRTEGKKVSKQAMWFWVEIDKGFKRNMVQCVV